MFKNKKIVVTGGAGFIGSNIVEELLNCECEVVVIDDLSTGNLKNIEPFLDRINFQKGSITDQDFLEENFKNADYVIHQAAIASVPRSIDDPIRTAEVNINGTLNIFNIARKVGVKRVVYASSSSVYGDSEISPKKEHMEYNPMSPYAVHKATNEMLAKVFSKIYGLETIGLRYFNVFGPKQDPNSAYAAVIPLFIKMIKEGKSPVINGDGETTRDFTFIKNVVDANLKACLAENVSGEVFNIACGDNISLNQLVQKINNFLNVNISTTYADFREGDIKHSLADINKARDILKYEVLVDFDEGLKKTIEKI